MTGGVTLSGLTAPQVIVIAMLAGIATRIAMNVLRALWDYFYRPRLRRAGIIANDERVAVCMACGHLGADFTVVCQSGCFHPLCGMCAVKYGVSRTAPPGTEQRQ